MKKKNEDVVSEKNMQFCVTVFLVQLVLAILVFGAITFVQNAFFSNTESLMAFFVMTPIQLILNILVWYIAGKLGVYNIFNSQKIAKKNLLPLRKAVIKDWFFFIGMMVMLSLSNTLNIIIVGISLFVNLPLLKKNFDKQVAMIYGEMTFE